MFFWRFCFSLPMLCRHPYGSGWMSHGPYSSASILRADYHKRLHKLSRIEASTWVDPKKDVAYFD